MAKVRSLELSLYTEDSVARLQLAMDEAQNTIDNENLSVVDQKSVNKTAKLLYDALNSMEPKAAGGDNSGDGNSSADSKPAEDKNSTNADDSKASDAGKAAKTGDTTIVLFALTSLLALTVTVTIRKRRNTR